MYDSIKDVINFCHQQIDVLSRSMVSLEDDEVDIISEEIDDLYRIVDFCNDL